MSRIALAVLLLLPLSLGAQWLDWRTPGIPRAADGSPNLAAPAPKTSDGKPDLSGVWQPAPNPYRFDLIQNLQDESIFRPAAEAVFQRRVVDFRRDDPPADDPPPSRGQQPTIREQQQDEHRAGGSRNPDPGGRPAPRRRRTATSP